MTSNIQITDLIVERYINSLLDGYTIKHQSIAVGTISGYTRAVNQYYKRFHLPEPWHKPLDDNAAVLLKDQSKFDDKSKKREPLHHKVMELMLKMAEEGNNLVS